jgi:Fic family protein
VHYQAPNAAILPQEMQCFLEWFNTEDTHTEPLIKAGIAHLWFVTLHPFEDGNGRMARALTDMLLARADGLPQRFYSMSTQIRLERNAYYDILEKTQKDDLDVTAWLQWFLECLQKALLASDVTLQKVINKHQFWAKNGYLVQNDRQILLITKLLEGFEGKLTTSKWAKIAKCSTDTALRDVQDLVQKQILRKTDEGGRSTNYELII